MKWHDQFHLKQTLFLFQQKDQINRFFYFFYFFLKKSSGNHLSLLHLLYDQKFSFYVQQFNHRAELSVCFFFVCCELLC